MSKDIKFSTICDHRIVQEQVYLESDKKTIIIPRLYASKVNFELFMNGFSIPKNHAVLGWYFINDGSSTYPFKRDRIGFINKIKTQNDFFQISYITDPSFCPKCKAKRNLDDVSYSKYGTPMFVKNEDKLLQEVKKFVLTYLGSNPFHTWIGTRIKQLIGSKNFDSDFIKAKLSDEINTSLSKYLDIQTQQSRYQAVTIQEALLSIQSVDIEQDSYEPTIWLISIVVANKSGDNLLLEKKLSTQVDF